MTKKKNKGEENLIPFNELSEEEHRRIASKGGKRSVEVRREKRHMRKMLSDLLAQPIKDERQIKVMQQHGFGLTEDGEQIQLTEKDVLLLKVVEGYRKGDYRFVNMALEILGEYAETKNVTRHEGSVDISNSIDKIEKYLKEEKKLDEEKKKEETAKDDES